jgi:hypothetical protein
VVLQVGLHTDKIFEIQNIVKIFKTGYVFVLLDAA